MVFVFARCSLETTPEKGAHLVSVSPCVGPLALFARSLPRVSRRRGAGPRVFPPTLDPPRPVLHSRSPSSRGPQPTARAESASIVSLTDASREGAIILKGVGVHKEVSPGERQRMTTI